MKLMTLNFFYRTNQPENDPLVASAYIQGDGNTKFPWPEGESKFYEVDLQNLPGGAKNWGTEDKYFRNHLQEELKKHIVMRNREPLKPWTRLSFKNIHKFGIARLRGFVYAKLIEYDGSEFDTEKAITVYGKRLGPERETFRAPGRNPDEVAAEQATREEMRAISLEKRRAVQGGDRKKAAEAEHILGLYKQAHKEGTVLISIECGPGCERPNRN